MVEARKSPTYQTSIERIWRADCHGERQPFLDVYRRSLIRAALPVNPRR